MNTQHTAFFIPDFRFSDEHLAEFKRRGFSDSVVFGLAAEVAILKGQYETNPPDAREQKRRLQAVYEVLNNCSKGLAAIDDLSASVLTAHASHLQAELPYRELRKVVDLYRDAACKAVDGTKVGKRGPVATKATRIAIAVGTTLRDFGIELNDTAKGKFVTAIAITFEALGVSRARHTTYAEKARQVLDSATG